MKCQNFKGNQNCMIDSIGATILMTKNGFSHNTFSWMFNFSHLQSQKPNLLFKKKIPLGKSNEMTFVSKTEILAQKW